jgi:hypothetical protein
MSAVRINAFITPSGVAFLYWSLGFSLLAVSPLWRIFRRAGLNPWPALTVFIPLIGLPLALSLLGFPRWPALPPRPVKARRRKRA